MSLLSFRSEGGVPERLVGLSIGFVAVIVGETAVQVNAWNGTGAVVPWDFLVGVATTLPFVVALGYAGYWLAESDVHPERHRRVLYWTVGGITVSLVLNLALMAVMPVESFLIAVGWIRWAMAAGAGVGVGVGVTEARAIQNAMTAERNAARAEHLEAQRDLLDYLNSLLRHEVLNASNVITGYADLLAEKHGEGTAGYEYSETIRRKSQDITTVIEDVRVLLQATDGRTAFEPVDVVDVVEAEAEKVTDLSDAVVVNVDAPASAEVSADALLPRVFGNLLSNAVEHNDSDSPRVSVSVDADDQSVTVDVADNGPGIPDREIDSLFERSGRQTADHGLGLYLVRKLVEHYGGRVALVETGPDGSVFRVELPRERDATVRGPPVDASEQAAIAFAGGTPQSEPLVES